MGGSQGGVLQVVGLPCGDEATIGDDPPPTLIFPIHGRNILPLHERAQDVRKWPFVVNVRHGSNRTSAEPTWVAGRHTLSEDRQPSEAP